MRILYINVNCSRGSTGKIVYDLYTQGMEDGLETAVCYGRGSRVEGRNIFKFGLDWETVLHALLTRITGWTGCFSFFSTRRLLAFIKDFQPDVVHIHELHAYFVNLKPLLTYLAKQEIPVVQTLHCEFTYTGKCGHAYECDQWKTGCDVCHKLRDYPKTLWFDHTAAMYRQKKALFNALTKITVIAPSTWLADRAKQSFLKERDIRVIYNGIDTENLFHPRETDDLRKQHGFTDEKVVLALAPNLLSASKGGHWVLQLAERMPDVRFVLVGVTEPKVAFPPNVTARGLIWDQRLLSQYYSLADCFVICSKKETFSLTCAESLCCGTPVAGFKSGAPETVFTSPTALFADYGNLDELEALVRIQLNTSIDKTKVAREGAERYSRQTMYCAYRTVYKQLIEERSK